MAGIPTMMMRGGTSKGLYFLAEDLPADAAERNHLLLGLLGSPDPRQIDGLGGAHPLTSKVAIVSRSQGGADVDYLFLQIAVDRAEVSDAQNCGNILAGVGPFAVERGLVPAGRETTSVRIRMVNTDSIATATFATPGGVPRYDGELAIDGVPGTAAPITISFEHTSRPLLPTGSVVDRLGGVEVTCIDNGMPSVMVAASDLGLTGAESPAELEANSALVARVAELRRAAGALMGLGSDSSSTVPKVVLLSPPRAGGVVATRSFIPVRVHPSIGVLGAVTVATGIQLPGAVGSRLAVLPAAGRALRVEHPSGSFDVTATVDLTTSPPTSPSAGVLRTARKLFDGLAFPRHADPDERSRG